MSRLLFFHPYRDTRNPHRPTSPTLSIASTLFPTNKHPNVKNTIITPPISPKLQPMKKNIAFFSRKIWEKHKKKLHLHNKIPTTTSHTYPITL